MDTKKLLKSYKSGERNFPGINLHQAKLSHVDLRGINLEAADLSGADLSQTNLSGCNLSRANLTNADLSRANLQSANLSEVNLIGADLVKANLDKTNLSAADLRTANLTLANLVNANLSQAEISGADFSGANLHNTNLIDSNINEAEFMGVDLTTTRTSKASTAPTQSSKLNVEFQYLDKNLMEVTIDGVKRKLYGRTLEPTCCTDVKKMNGVNVINFAFDHILTTSSKTIDRKVYKGLEFHSDHNPVISIIRI